jgi:LssY C-terminus
MPFRTGRGLVADWWQRDWQTLPVRRVDLDGETKEPITFQWAGSLADLETTLQQKDWRAATPWTLTGALAWFTSRPDPMNLPTLATLEGGRLPSLTLVHSGDGRASTRFTLRMWATDIDLQNGHSTELWIGSIVVEDLVNWLSLITLPQDQPNANTPRDLLAASIEAARLTIRTEQQVTGTWDGRVLLAHDGNVTVN